MKKPLAFIVVLGSILAVSGVIVAFSMSAWMCRAAWNSPSDALKILAEIPSPDTKARLTIYEDHRGGWGGYQTVFNLRAARESLGPSRLSIRRWKVVRSEGDILVLNGPWFPYGIIWTDSNHLVVRLPNPIEYEFLYYGKISKMWSTKKDAWRDIMITYDVAGEKLFPNETRIK